ncbi:MAG: hypothetical protein HKO64_02990, partial [Xanthomonadales bacterium]|nr:hypothetical protein [Xanthomonadales bacterium]
MKNPHNTGSVPLFPPSHTQRGMVTVFIMLMLMLLMASMLSYSARNAISEQQMSANELRQKRAFHTAESGLELATEWMLANNVLINADVEDMLGTNIDGWMVAGSQRWTQCAEVDYSADKSHPCWGESLDSRRDDSFFYQWQGSTKLPINAGTMAATSDTRVSVEALLCLVDIDLAIDPEIASPVLGCHTDPALVDSSKFLVTLLARGESDCLNGQCNAEALVAKQVSNFSIVAFARAPGIPLVTKSSFPPSGTSEIVANPNAGGPGVPLSVWANSNNSCPAHPAVDPSSGSWATCEAWEWYGTHEVPAGITCSQ